MPNLTDLPIHRLNLDVDARFRIRFGPVPGRLVQSIREAGILDPPLVVEGDPCDVVCGFRRLGAARQLGHRVVSVRVLTEKECPAERALRMAIEHNTWSGPLGPMDVALVLKRHEELLGRDERRWCKQVLPACGVPPTARSLRQHLSLLELPADAQQAVHQDVLGLKHAELLMRFPTGEREAVFGALWHACHLSHSERLELLHLLDELARRDSTTASRILVEPSVSAILSDGRIDSRQRGHRLRRSLAERRWPTLMAQRARLRQALDALGLPQDVRVTTPSLFEDDALEIRLRIRSAEQWQDHAAALLRVGQTGHLERLFRCLTCDDST